MNYLLTLLFCVSSFLSFAQPHDLLLEGIVKEKDENKKLADASITVLREGIKIKETSTPSTGKFKFNLEYEQDYIIEISKKGYAGKTIEVSTKGVSVESGQKGFYYAIDVNLIEENENEDSPSVQNHVGLLYYNPETDSFDFERK